MNERYEQLYSLSLRKGFIWPSAEIYGGMAGFYDYGPLGSRLKRNWEDSWLDYFLGLGDRYFLLDTTAIMPHAPLKASGHVELFSDLLVKCQKCGESFKADDLLGEVTRTSGEGLKAEELDARISSTDVKCLKCKGELGKAKDFNMMFTLNIGSEGQDKGFLRPETAQGAYLNFKRGFEIARKKLPFGLASIGRAYRNEISPRQGVYRMRELIQAELQIFFDPSRFDKSLDFDGIENYPLRVQFFGDERIYEIRCSDLSAKKGLPRFFVYHMAMVQKFYLERIHVPTEKFRFLELGEKERAFYNKLHYDVEVNLESLDGFKELGGIHYRTDYDLTRHQEGSKEVMEVTHDGEKLIPHVLELSFGIDRNVWALLDLFYEKTDRTVLRLQPFLSPYFAAVFPLVKKDGLDDKARKLHNDLRKDFLTYFDDSGSIGRRYARMDEIGTPFCITVDYDTMEDDTVTVRERDSTQQKRVPIGELTQLLQELLTKKKVFTEM